MQVRMNTATEKHRYSRSQSLKWSDVQFAIFDLCDDLVSIHHRSDEVLAIADRFSQPSARPLPVCDCPAAEHAVAAASAIVPWVAGIDGTEKRIIGSFNLAWYRKFNETCKDADFLSSSLVLGHQGDFTTGWRCVNITGYT